METRRTTDERKSKIDKHMNQYMVKAAHETANFLAQQPKNSAAAVNGQVYMRNKVDKSEVPDDSSETSRHNSEDLNVRQSDPKNRNFDVGYALQPRATVGQGRQDNQGCRYSPHENSKRDFPSTTNPRKDVKSRDHSNASGSDGERSRGEQRQESTLYNSNSPRSTGQPSGTFVIKTDDNGGVETSMNWSSHVRQNQPKFWNKL